METEQNSNPPFLEQKKLPNATTAMVLGIVSYVLCCCSGIGGVLTAAIALFLTSKDTKTYQESPEEYSNFNQVKTAKTVALIALILSILITIYSIYMIVQMGGVSGYMDSVREMMEDMGV